jgi:hypothetical protein
MAQIFWTPVRGDSRNTDLQCIVRVLERSEPKIWLGGSSMQMPRMRVVEQRGWRNYAGFLRFDKKKRQISVRFFEKTLKNVSVHSDHFPLKNEYFTHQKILCPTRSIHLLALGNSLYLTLSFKEKTLVRCQIHQPVEAAHFMHRRSGKSGWTNPKSAQVSILCSHAFPFHLIMTV